MKIVILAGGIGKRMWSIQTDKCLIPFLGKPLLHHVLKKVTENISYDQIILIANPQNKDSLSQIAKDLKLEVKIVVQQQAKGIADAILAASGLIEGEVLIINGDDLFDANVYQDVVNIALKSNAEAVSAGREIERYFPGGYFKLDGEKITGIVEKPGEGNQPSNIWKLVVDYFRDGNKLVSHLKSVENEKDDVYETVLDQLIKDGLKMLLSRYAGPYLAIKYPWHILDATAYFLSTIEQKIDPGANISDKAIIEGNVVIEAGAKLFEGAVIKGPCYIGKNVIVGNNSMVRESNLEEGCVTGFNSDITRSYIGANSWFHTNYIGDSVIEGDFGMGSGAVLANLRLDNHTIRVGEVDSGRDKLGLIAGKGSRVGVNASTMPGARIGSNSLVGPGVVLYGDVKENTKVIVKQELQESQHTPALTSYDQFRSKI